jgi:hypothetical protein
MRKAGAEFADDLLPVFLHSLFNPFSACCRGWSRESNLLGVNITAAMFDGLTGFGVAEGNSFSCQRLQHP